MTATEPDDQSPIQQKISESNKDIREFFSTFISFIRTKRAIHRGLPLYDWTAADLQKQRMLGPWKFNLFEVGLTGGIASVTTNVVDLMHKPSDADPLGSLIGMDIDPEYLRLLKETSGWVTPFSPPLVLTTIVLLMGWASLKRADSTPISRRRSRHAYLYFDGTYGFYSQLLLAFGISFLFSEMGQTLLGSGSLFAILIGVGTVAAFLVQANVSLRKIPYRLFAVNGYSSRPSHFWRRKLTGDPPSNKIVFAQIVGGWPLILAVNITLTAIAMALAALIFWLQSLI